MPGRKIAVLDDYQSLSKPHFDKLREAGYDVTIFTDTLLPYNRPETPQDVKDALVRRLEPFNIICTMRERTPIPAELVSKLPNLELLLTTGGRNASIAVKACRARGIPVAGTPNTGGQQAQKRGPDSTTTHCVAMILALARNISDDDSNVKAGGWQTVAATPLAGKVFGTLGLGRLGTSVSKIMATAFGMKVVAWSSSLTQEAADEKARQCGLPVVDEDGEHTFKVVTKDELFRAADVVSVHLVLSDRSRGLITKDDFSKMKRSALFINTARGPIVNDDDLFEAAEKSLVRGIATDVFDLEPLPEHSRWRKSNWGRDGRARVLLTPHMGYVEEDSMGRWYEHQAANIARWEKGQPLEVEYEDSGYYEGGSSSVVGV